MRSPACLIVFLFCFQQLSAQDISGVWKGSMTTRAGGCFSVYNIELQIQIEGTRITGASYHYSDLTNYVKEEFMGTYNPADRSMTIAETRVLTFKIPPDCIPCIKTYQLSYRQQDKMEFLNGETGGVMMNGMADCPPGRIILTRSLDSDFKGVDPTVSLTSRANELVREIRVDTGKIRLDFYDNGQIDGDTISVFVNREMVLTMKRLTGQPVTIFVEIDATRKEQEVVMVAENLGSIPPNTALMLVTAGNKRYQLYLTSTEKKNAMVRFIYEAPH